MTWTTNDDGEFHICKRGASMCRGRERVQGGRERVQGGARAGPWGLYKVGRSSRPPHSFPLRLLVLTCENTPCLELLMWEVFIGAGGEVVDFFFRDLLCDVF